MGRKNHSDLNALDHEITGGASSSQFSFPSQPPDIRDWFSSYVYESPESLGLPQIFDGLVVPEEGESETEDESDKLLVKDPSLSKNECWIEPKINGRSSSQSWRIQYGSYENGYSSLSKEQQSLYLQSGEEISEEYSNRNKEDEECCISKDNLDSPKIRDSGDENKSHREEQEEVNPPRSEGRTKESKSTKDDLSANFQDGFVSVKKNDATRLTDQNVLMQSTSLGSSRYAAIYQTDRDDCVAIPVDADCNCKVSCRCTGNESKLVHKIIQPKPKRKLNLQKLLSDEVLLNRTQVRNDPISKPSGADGETFALVDSIQNKDLQEKQVIQVNEDQESKEKFPQQESKAKAKSENLDVVENDSPSSRERAMRDGHFYSESLQLNRERRASFHEEQGGGRKRNPLDDKTNVHAAKQTEISGKWKRPRSSKPYMGPPMKQLRLERWVKRVEEHPFIR